VSPRRRRGGEADQARHPGSGESPQHVVGAQCDTVVLRQGSLGGLRVETRWPLAAGSGRGEVTPNENPHPDDVSGRLSGHGIRDGGSTGIHPGRPFRKGPGDSSRAPGPASFWRSIAGGAIRTTNVRRLNKTLFVGILRVRIHDGPGACSRLASAATDELQAQVQSSSNTRNSASHDASRHASLRPQPASAMHVTSASKAASRSPPRTLSPHSRAQASSGSQA